MKNPPFFRSRFGVKQIFDPVTQLKLDLPQGYRIYNRLPDIWIGGSEDGAVFLYIEKIKATALELSGPLAGGDLDIQVIPKGRGQQFGDGVTAQDITCRMREEDLPGLWLRITFNKRYHYLLVLAGKDPGRWSELQSTALELARGIRSQLGEPADLVAVAC